MEEVEFQTWVKQLQETKNKYSAIFDPNTMKLKRVGPSYALEHEDNCLEIDADIAERILSGEIRIHSCFLDTDNNKINIAETRHLIKIDDVLHRVPLTNWSDITNPDIYIVLNYNQKKITIDMNVKWNGTFNSTNQTNIKTRKLVWSGDTMLEFLITDYNDPNIIYDSFSFYVQDLINTQLEFKINVPHKKISVYTKRIFKNYIMDIK